MRKVIIETYNDKVNNIKRFSYTYLGNGLTSDIEKLGRVIDLVSEDIHALLKEIDELRPLANRLNKLRKELKLLDEFKSLLIKERNALFDKESEM